MTEVKIYGALRKSLELHLRDFPPAKAIFQLISFSGDNTDTVLVAKDAATVATYAVTLAVSVVL